MNPPSALYGAMNKDRKPFTYTPGGLDLSEIKSERMAQRLMRNAMSEGVPDTPVQTIPAQHSPLNSCAIPNYNCLPVQVFPTFPLPANPKSLLRTRSTPDPPKEPKNIAEIPLPSKDKFNLDLWTNVNKPSVVDANYNDVSYKPSVLNDYKNDIANRVPILPSTNYGSSGHTEVILPEKSYEAEYFVAKPEGNVKLMENKLNDIKLNILPYTEPVLNAGVIEDPTAEKYLVVPSLLEDRSANQLQQKEVTIVKKQTKVDAEDEQNGDTDAAIVVKLPSKKSSAKTETKVEVSKKVLPDGSIEEVKTTITKTTKDGKTEIKTETETQITPKDEEEIVEIEEEEEDNENADIEDNLSEQNEEVEKRNSSTTNVQNNLRDGSKNYASDSEDENKEQSNKTERKENGLIITGEEKVEISTTKNVVVIQSNESEEEQEEEIEEQEEVEEKEEIEDKENEDVEVEQVVVLKKINKDEEKPIEIKSEEIFKEDDSEVVEEEEEEVNDEGIKEDEIVTVDTKKEIEEAEEEEEVEAEEVEAEEVEAEEVEAEETIADEEEQTEAAIEVKEKDLSKEETQESEAAAVLSIDETQPENDTDEGRKIVEDNQDIKDSIETSNQIQDEKVDETTKETEITVTTEEPSIDTSKVKEEIQQVKEEFTETNKKSSLYEPKVSFREPSIPLEKVEDIEIKPIGPAQEIIKKCHTEIITRTKDEPTGALSTQTEYNRIENIVTVNRSSKTLDPPYGQGDLALPTVKTYFVPPTERILSTPQPISRPYQPVYTPEPQTERRHSLLLDRLSMERQIPVQQSDIYENNYQYNTQSNQSYEQNQWLQEPQSEVLTVSNVKPSTITKNQQWYQQSKREENITSNVVTPTPIMPSQQLSQSQTQSQYETYVQPQYTPKPEYQPVYKDINQNSYKTSATNLQQNTYPTYTPKPSWVSSTYEPKPTPAAQLNQYSTLQKESKESYQKSTQQFSSSYVPPPWEQDSSYVVENQNLYQPPPQPAYSPNINQTWKPKPTSKFSKPAPTSYIPPAPNQSFVKPVTAAEQSKLPGRKTYYSEYERRYISVPESTYIPSETKFQAQPDPSPQYYFDNNEPLEPVEPQWRKELREFTEKTTQSTISHTETNSVRPPWEDDPKYITPAPVTPTWTQTLRPRSWRERSYEPEYVGSKEWPKTNTLGRGRPQSSYVNSNMNTIQERPRGVSVDRYNPNSYQSPSEHPPVQGHTLNPIIHPKAYHNPNVPAYHSRASAEPREQSAPYIQRSWGESRAPPVQSRSFKYLQWITGTED